VRLLLSIFLAILILSPFGVKLAVVSWWSNNQQQIIALQCENKTDLTVLCSGKCVLVKTLDKFSTDDAQSNNKDFSGLLKAGIDVYTFDSNNSFSIPAEKLKSASVPNFINCLFDTQIDNSRLRPPIS